VLTNPTFVKDHIEDRLSKDTSAQELDTIEQGLKRVARDLAKASQLVFDFADDEDAVAPFKQKVRDLTALKRTLQERRETVLEQQVHWNTLLSRWESLVWAFYADPEGQLDAFRDRLSYAEKRHWLATLGVRVAVYSTSHDPRWELTMTIDPSYYLPTDEQLREEGAWFDDDPTGSEGTSGSGGPSGSGGSKGSGGLVTVTTTARAGGGAGRC